MWTSPVRRHAADCWNARRPALARTLRDTEQLWLDFACCTRFTKSRPPLLAAVAEPVKPGETTSHADLMSASGVGSLIQATVGSFGGVRSAVPESGRVGGVGGVEGDGALGADLGGGAVVDRRRGVQPDAGVAVDVVVVIEERGAERAGVFDRAEPAGERRAVLEGLEVGLRVRVVVGHVGAAVAAGDTEVDEQLSDRLGGHRRAPVGVQGELTAFDAVAWRGCRR